MTSSPDTPVRNDLIRWTPRQREVLDLIAQGRTNPEIAEALGITLNTAKWHVSEIISIIGVETREEAADYWREYNGLPARLRRRVRSLFAGPVLLRIAMGLGILGVVAGGIVLALALQSLGDESSPAAAGTETPTAPAPTTNAVPSLPGQRTQLKVCVSLPAAQSADVDPLRARVKAAIDRLRPEYPEWWAAFGSSAEVDACPGEHIPFPNDAPNLSAGILANGEVLGRRLDSPKDASPYRTFIFVNSDGPAGYERAPFEWSCSTLHQCDELTNALFVDDEVAASEQRLADALRLAFGMSDPRATASPAGTAPALGPLPDGVTRHVLARDEGGGMNPDYGVLFLDPATGGGELWELPGRPDRVSPSGRYIAWVAEGASELHILDTRTGTEVVLPGVLDVPSFSPDEQRFVGLSVHGSAAIYATATGDLILQMAPPGNPAPGWVVAEWSPDGRGVVGATKDHSFVVWAGNVGDVPFPLIGMQWSHASDRVVLAGDDQTIVFDPSTGARLDLGVPGGSNPRWSADDRWIALDRGIRRTGSGLFVFNADTGEEVLRVSGQNVCVGDYWDDTGAQVFGQFEPPMAVQVPSGELVPSTEWPRFGPREFSLDWGDDNQPGPTLLKDGQVVARVNVHADSVPFSSDDFAVFTTDSRAVWYIGVYGTDLCGEDPRFREPFEVLLPPF